MNSPLISVVLPAHNEAEIISDVVRLYYNKICRRLQSMLVVAEDGSTDGTSEILFCLKREVPMVLLSDHNRKGYARGVADALRRCSSDWVFFSDSDGQYDVSDFWRLWERRDGYDMIIGRKMRRSEGLHRTVLAKGFHALVNGLFGLNLHDADCGFRLIRREVIQSVLDEVRFLKYSFWAEFTIRACLKGFRVCEVSIKHNARLHGDTHIYKPSKIPLIVLKQLKGLAHLYADLRKRR
jgi:glycosyltransferase involved in cell wall biosynthesis